jgi:hypothetical protein
MNLPATTRPDDPSELGYPPTLALEVALKSAPIKNICMDYNLSKEDWDRMRVDPMFLADVMALQEELKKDGMSFRLKARMQSEEFLKESWKIVHDRTGEVPPNVKADLIKATWRVSGLEPTRGEAVGNANAFQININFGGEQ